MKIRSKLPDVGVTIFTVMSKLAADHGAYNLSQGFPDFDVSSDLISLVEHYMRSGHNQYAPMQGVPVLRERIADKIRTLYDADVDPESQITVTSGATEALYAAIAAVVRPDDEVIILEPAYDSYAPVVELNGGQPVYRQMKYPDYRIDWDEIAESVTNKTRLIILNSPHNPTGKILSGEDVAALKEIVQRNGLFILSDEVYEHIIFDGAGHQSMLRDPELAGRSFVVSSFGKTYHTTGWKIGYCVAPPALTDELRKVHQFLTFSTNTPTQLAYAEFLQKKGVYLDLPAFYQQKRDMFLDLIRESRFKPLACRGTYFQMLDYSEISDQPDVAFAEWMTVDKRVAAIPPSVFYHRRDDHKVLRFCFAKKDDTLKKAAAILCRI
ncbi:MAG: hypothetical protein AMJ54_06945 [Deltaproteobacteria bacterium SG8_13]|nr:MAG: hypothetical protein AMJ54_06945 [Deltaproteobacteria bacterium SG8_13]